MATLRQYRQALARSLDDLAVYEIASSTATTTVISALADSTSNASDRRYDGRWAYISSGFAVGEGTTVKPGGFAPSTGTLTVAKFWETTPHDGDELELTGLFPAISGLPGADIDYRTLVNRALSRLMLEDRIDATTVADQYTYGFALATYPWLDRMTRVMGVLDPPRATGLPRRPTWRPHTWRIDGGAMTLEFAARPYPTSGATFQIAVLRPADTLISGADSTTGLVADSDTAVPSVEEVVVAGRYFAFEALLSRSKGRPSGDWSGQFAAAREDTMKLARWDRSQEAAPEPQSQQGAA